ncbi:hypothetical protein [Bacillus cereus]
MKTKTICDVDRYYENEKYDSDRYNFIKRTPLSTQEISIVVDFKENEITGDILVYGFWDQLELDECIKFLKTLQPSEIKRDFNRLIETV